MYEGNVSPQLCSLLQRYKHRFNGNGVSLFATTLDHDALIARIQRALDEGKPYDPLEEEYGPEIRRGVKEGSILL